MAESEWSVLWLSVQVAGLATLALLVPAILLGWVLARTRFRGHALLDAAVHLPLVVPPVVTGWVLLLLCAKGGPLGRAWAWCFGQPLAFTATAAVLAAAIMALPLFVRSIRLALEFVDPRLETAAASCGAPPWRVWLTVTMPLALPGIIAGAMLAFARALGEFGATITVAGNIPGETQTIPLAIYSATQVPGGDNGVIRLVAWSAGIAIAALILSEWLARRMRSRLGVAT